MTLRRHDPRTLLAGAYLLTVGAIEVLRRAGHLIDPDALASTPARVAHGAWWGLATSGLVVDGAAAPQLAALALTGALLLRRVGPAVTLRAAAVAHVGSATLAYAGVGVLALATPGAVDRVADLPDYGISCVFGGVLGALCASALIAARRSARRRELALVAPCVAWLVAAVGLWSELTAVEHLLAFAFGAGVVARPARAHDAATPR